MYRYIDLFAGIGGFRLGFDSLNCECVFSSEIDEHAQKMYKANYGVMPYGDIKNIELDEIPPFDILTAGFPCQPFSIAGEKKGFNDARGTLFFEIMKIIRYHKPKVVFLENVKHLKNHDSGKTLKVIIDLLETEGYVVSWNILNAKDFGVPQNRERTIIIAASNGIEFNFDRLKKTQGIKIENILEKEENFEFLNESEYTLLANPKEQASGLIFAGYRNKSIRKKGVRPNTSHLSRVHKQPNRIYSSAGTHPTLSSQEPTGRYYILHKNKVRKLTLKECYRLMGFPDDFKLIGSKAKLYNRVGNSIVVPMVKAIATEIENQIFSEEYIKNYKPRAKQLDLFKKIV